MSEKIHEPDPDQAPPARGDREFPCKDIDAPVIKKAENLLDWLGQGDYFERLAAMNDFTERKIRSWQKQKTQHRNFEGMNELAINWTRDAIGHGADANHLQIGLSARNTIAFALRTGLFPVEFKDYSSELKTMSEYDLAMMGFFAQSAWTSMKTHAAIYDIMNEFRNHLCELYLSDDKGNYNTPTLDDPKLILLDASMALPYSMSAASNMENVLPYQLPEYERYLLPRRKPE